MSKLVPSPDWFVGLDSLDLCESGRFLDKITVEVRHQDFTCDDKVLPRPRQNCGVSDVKP